MSQNISELLEHWYIIKNNISSLKHEEQYYKHKIMDIMNEKQTDKLKTKKYICTRTIKKRTSMIKNYVPDDIWIQYATVLEYPNITLKKVN